MKKQAAKAPEHQYNSKTLEWFSSSHPSGLRGLTVCNRCGSRAFCEMGERLSVVCTPTPAWLREQAAKLNPSVLADLAA